MASEYIPLVDFPTAESICNGEQLNDHLASLLAEAVNADGIVTMEEIEKLEEVYPLIFNTRRDDPLEVRAKTLYKILNPIDDPDKALEAICSQAIQLNYNTESREKIVEGFITLLGGCHQLNADGAELIMKLYAGLKLDSTRLKDQISEMFRNESMPKFDFSFPLDTSFSMPSIFSRKGDGIQTFTPATSKFNNEIREHVREIRNIAQQIDAVELMDDCGKLYEMLQEQPFKIVIAGEVKRGKSTLFNALVGQELSPVVHGLTETATNFKLSYADEARYTGEWISESQIEKAKKYYSDSNRERELKALESLLEGEEYNPGTPIAGISSLTEISDYISAHGAYTPLVKEIEYSAEIPMLKSGAVLVDTPGLNDPIGIRTEFSLEESMSADCIIFVFSAEFRGASEIEYLKSLVSEGRVVNLIIAISHIDKFESSTARDAIIEEVQGLVQPICDDTEVSVLGYVPLDAKQAMRSRCDNKYSHQNDRTGLSQIVAQIEGLLEQDARKERYRSKVKERYCQLVGSAKAYCVQYVERMRSALPPKSTLKLLESNSQVIKETNEKLIQSLMSRLHRENVLVDAMVTNYAEEGQKTKELCLSRLQNEINKQVHALGSNFAKPSKWTDFDEKESVVTINNTFQPFMDKLKMELKLWDENLKEFKQNNEKALESDIQVLAGNMEKLAGACATDSRLLHLSTKINSSMKAAEKIGLGAGAASLLHSPASFANLLPAIANPTALGAIVGAALVYTVTRFLTKPDKEKFIEKKITKCDKCLTGMMEPYRNQLVSAGVGIKNEFYEAAKEQYIPIISKAISATQYNELYIDVIRKAADDAPRIGRVIEGKLKAIDNY